MTYRSVWDMSKEKKAEFVVPHSDTLTIQISYIPKESGRGRERTKRERRQRGKRGEREREERGESRGESRGERGSEKRRITKKND